MSDALPEFPQFTHLDLVHKDVLQEIAGSFPSYSDFNFVSLFTWDTEGDVLVSKLNSNLVIKFTDYIDNDSFYSFLGTNKINETAHTLISHAKEQGMEGKLKLVPHTVATRMSADKFEVYEDRDNHDYILSVGNLVEFKSSQYRGKKNLLNRFYRTYGDDFVSKEIDLDDQQKKEEFIEVLQAWKMSRNKEDKEVANEFKAIMRAVNDAKHIGIKAFGVYIKSKLVGFTLFEILPNKVAVIHFDKADVSYVGLFEHLKHDLAKHLGTYEIEFINYEQDLGIEGLRHAKEAYHPVDYLKKYTVTLKT